MAAQAPPARPAQDLAVVVSQGADPSLPVKVPAAHPVIALTPFLDWASSPNIGNVPHKQMLHFQMIRAFGRRLKKVPPVLGPVPPVSVGSFMLAFNSAAWTRYLQELIDSGLAQSKPSDMTSLDKAIDSLVLTNPENMKIDVTDWQLGEASSAAAAVAAQPAVRAGGGRRAQAAVPAILGRAALNPRLEFMSEDFLPITNLEIPEDPSPWAAISFLVGALGPCLTQAARNAPGSAARMTATALANGLTQFYSTVSSDPDSLAGELPDYLRTVMLALPAPFRSHGNSMSELRADLRDSIIYLQGREERARVETMRIFLIAPRYALPPPSPRVGLTHSGSPPTHTHGRATRTGTGPSLRHLRGILGSSCEGEGLMYGPLHL